MEVAERCPVRHQGSACTGTSPPSSNDLPGAPPPAPARAWAGRARRGRARRCRGGAARARGVGGDGGAAVRE
jgi:hypothetical protein